MLVLRDVIFGNRRCFRELLQGSEEGIASNILSSRLKRLVAAGLLTREEATRGQRAAYSLAEAGIQTLPVRGLWRPGCSREIGLSPSRTGIRYSLPPHPHQLRQDLLPAEMRRDAFLGHRHRGGRWTPDETEHEGKPGAEALLDSWAAHIDDLLDPQWDMMGGGHHWHPDPDAPLETVRTRLRKKFGPTGTWDGAEAGQAGVLATLFLVTLLVDPWDVDGPAVTLTPSRSMVSTGRRNESRADK